MKFLNLIGSGIMELFIKIAVVAKMLAKRHM
jgi:hypothetical protein